MKKLLVCLAVFALGFMTFLYISPTWGDSGFDTGYGGGGGYDSGGGFSGGGGYSGGGYDGGSWDFDVGGSSSSGSHSSGRPPTELEKITGYVFLILMLLVVVPTMFKSTTSAVQDVYKEYYFDMNINKLQEILPNETLDTLKKMAYKKFIDVQNAWMEFDYDSLKKLCSDELYNSYHEQLEVLKLKKQKNIMSDFKTINIRIINVEESEKYINVQVFLKIAFFDFIIDEEGNVVQGTKAAKVINNYRLNFIKSKDQDIKECPRCGAPLKNIVDKRCSYCRSKIALTSGDFILSKKTNEHTYMMRTK